MMDRFGLAGACALLLSWLGWTRGLGPWGPWGAGLRPESPPALSARGLDLDGDGYPAWTSGPLGGRAAAAPLAWDCDDRAPNVHPGAKDPFCDQIDQDCDGTLPEAAWIAGGGRWSTIQAALDAAGAGDTVGLCPRVARESLVLHSEGELHLLGSPGAVLWPPTGQHGMEIQVAPGASVRLEGFEIRGATVREAAPAAGGAILALGQLHLVDMILRDHSAANTGGAIDWTGRDGEALEVEDSLLEGNSAGAAGSAISAAGEGFGELQTLRILHSRLLSNSAGANGGDISSDGRAGLINITIEESELIGATSAGDGGSIRVDEELATLHILNRRIAGATAQGEGGALYWFSFEDAIGCLRVEGSVIEECIAAGSADSHGGGMSIHARGPFQLSISESQLLWNSTSGQGGGLRLEAASRTSVELGGVDWEGNSAESGAGGLHIEQTTGEALDLSSASGSWLSQRSAEGHGALHIDSGTRMELDLERFGKGTEANMELDLSCTDGSWSDLGTISMRALEGRCEL